MPDPLVSVITPTFNRAYCLGRTLDSALAQTHAALEVLVIDDGSTDGTRKLVLGRYGGDGRVRYAHQPNAGVAAARNHGLRLARGEFVAFLDSDDVWKPWKLEAQLACLRCLPHAGMIWSDMEAVDDAGRLVAPHYLRTMYHSYRWFTAGQLFTESRPLAEVAPALAAAAGGGTVFAGDLFSPMVMGNLVHTSTVLLRRERLERVGGFNERFRSGEDYDFHLRTCREGPVAFLDLDTIQYQTGLPDRLTRHTSLIASSFLQTLTAVLGQSGDRVRLPRRMVRASLANAHCWLGEELLAEGDRAGARRHLARGLWYRAWQPRAAVLLALACLPPSGGRVLRRLHRRVRRRGSTPDLARNASCPQP